jgi:basic membrane protein A
VDTDWAVTCPEYVPVILTGVQKRLDVGVVSAVEAIIDGRFTGGVHAGTLENGNVGLAPFHSLISSVTSELQAEVIADDAQTLP